MKHCAYSEVSSAENTLAHLCLWASIKYKERIAFSAFSEGKIRYSVTYSQMGHRACQLASVLKQTGVKKGDRVLLLSDNCPQWPITYFGISLAGAVSVPLLTGFSSQQILNIADHCAVSAICASSGAAEKLRTEAGLIHNENLGAEPLSISEIPFIFIDSITAEGTSAEVPSAEGASNEGISVSVNGIKKYLSVSSEDYENYYKRNSSRPDDLASIIYTSGTQGNSKGVMLSNNNIISCALSSFTFVKLLPRDRLLSVLPLAHSYECSLGLIAPVMSGSSITYIDRPPSPSVLLPALKIIKPTKMITVPLLIEKIYKNAIAAKLTKSRLYKFILTRSLAAWIAGRKLISALGGRLRFLGIGGAPLSPDVEKFLLRAKFPYSRGYGLTEAAPLAAGNSLRYPKKSGFMPPKNVRLRIEKCGTNADEGEIQLQGPNVMMGYYNDEEKTREAFTADGWLKTGDLGSIDKKGRLHIRGRLKTIILGPSGENIYPEEIEGLLGSSSLIEESLVYPGKKGELVALVRLSEAAQLKQRAKNAAGIVEHALEELRSWTNKKLAAFSRLSKIEIKHEPFEKTPTMKIKRYLYLGSG